MYKDLADLVIISRSLRIRLAVIKISTYFFSVRENKMSAKLIFVIQVLLICVAFCEIYGNTQGYHSNNNQEPKKYRIDPEVSIYIRIVI